MADEQAILNDDIKTKYPNCPECNAILDIEEDAEHVKHCKACEGTLINYLD